MKALASSYVAEYAETETTITVRDVINSFFRDFPFGLINSISARLDTSPETLLFNSISIIPKNHRNFNNFPANATHHLL